jgi:hypothetical protein
MAQQFARTVDVVNFEFFHLHAANPITRRLLSGPERTSTYQFETYCTFGQVFALSQLVARRVERPQPVC